ncbi:MAG: hypothetical protein RLZZ117_2402 [Cyanobacteriota bacterium]|jgi:hypothetical protein
MKLVVWGNSHLHAFRDAWLALDRENRVPACFLPTPNVANFAEVVHHGSATATLNFPDGRTQAVTLPPADESVLVIVGNGNYGHFSTFERPGCLPPLWVYSPRVSQEQGVDPDLLPSIAPISSTLFEVIYRDKPLHGLLHRCGFSKDYFAQFLKVFIFISPTPASSFFRRQRHSLHYLEAACLRQFKQAYGRLFERQVQGLGLQELTLLNPSASLEAWDGTTSESYLLDEALQVHANQDYWQQRIAASPLLLLVA